MRVRYTPAVHSRHRGLAGQGGLAARGEMLRPQRQCQLGGAGDEIVCPFLALRMDEQGALGGDL